MCVQFLIDRVAQSESSGLGRPCSEGPRVEACAWILSKILKCSCFCTSLLVWLMRTILRLILTFSFNCRNRNPPVYVAKMKAKVIYSKCSFSLTLVPSPSVCPPRQCQWFLQAQGWSAPAPACRLLPPGQSLQLLHFAKLKLCSH